MSVNKNHQVVENELKLKLHGEYLEFLNTYGDYCVDGYEIYGYSPEYKDINKLPCVIGATRLYKDSYSLNSHEIVISHSGFEDFIVVLDNQNGTIFEVSSTGKRKKISNSFNQWFESFSTRS
jgi:hypothetical protein